MNEFKKNAPETSKIKKKQPFRVPDNYFDDFSARLHTRLETETDVLPQSKGRVIRMLKPILGLAASFALIFLLVYWPIKSFLPDYVAKTETTIETTTTEEDSYISYVERIDENSFFALIRGVFTPDDAEDDFNDEELLSYLSANVSDYDLYLNTEN
jgi:hypothetical protein